MCVFQLKKLVYVYLVRYAEEQQDLALLSISTFQRALKVTHVVCVCTAGFDAELFFLVVFYHFEFPHTHTGLERKCHVLYVRV